MNDSSVFASPVQTNFYPVNVYLTVLRLVFFGSNLTHENEPIEPFPIVNALYEYLDKSENETEAKRILTRRMLQGKDLHGGNENETLDLAYINATFDYIVRNAVFSKNYGSVSGYLAKIVSASNDSSLMSLKMRIIEDLSIWDYQNPTCSFSNLSSLAVKRITETLIWPLFPQPDHDMNVTSVDYIYAQAGLMYTRLFSKNNTHNLTFNDYIALSQSVESLGLSQGSYRPGLQIFALPALLFYAYTNRETFQSYKVKNLVKSESFQNQIILNLFSYLDDALEKLNKIDPNTDPEYRYFTALNKFRNRTQVAKDITRERCALDKIDDFDEFIKGYKLKSSFMFCEPNKKYYNAVWTIIKLPNLEDEYMKEVNNVTDNYPAFLKLLIQDELEKAGLLDVINSPDTVISQVHIEMPERLVGKKIIYPHSNATLFAINHQNKSNLYAVVNNYTHLFLFKDTEDHTFFLNKFGILDLPLCEREKTPILVRVWFYTPLGYLVEKSLYNSCENTKLWEIKDPATFKMQPEESLYPLLKNRNEVSGKFVERLTNLVAENTKAKFKSENYDPTTTEAIIIGLKQSWTSFIPFRDCVYDIKEGEIFSALISCPLDVVTLIPIVGPIAKYGLKLSTVAGRVIMAAIGASVRTMVLKQSFRLALTSGLRTAVIGLSEVTYKTFLTKQMFKEISIATVRTIDPGFELIGTIVYKGPGWLAKLSAKVLKSFEKMTTKSGVQFEKIKNFLKSVDKSGERTRLLDDMDDHEVFYKIFPEGEHPFGPKLVRLSNGVAELRKGENGMLAVIPRISQRGEVVFEKIDLETEKMTGIELRYNNDGTLKVFDHSTELKVVKTDDLLEPEWRYKNPREFFKTTEVEIPAVCRL